MSLSLKKAAQANAAYFASSDKIKPIALIFGATSGIGRGFAKTLAKYTKGNCRILVVGRNRAAGEKLIKSFPPCTAGGDHEFISCDLTSLKNVDAVTKDLLGRLPKLNYLVSSAGSITFEGYVETEEGNDRRTTMFYYSRFKLIHDLMPLLQKAKDAGQDAKVINILSAGNGKAVDLDNLGFKNKKYSLLDSGRQTITYIDLMNEEFASRHPTMSFAHSYPGGVRTNLAGPVISPIFNTLLYPFLFSEEQCGEYQVQAMLLSEGACLKGQRAQDLGPNKYSSSEARKALWKHSLEATGCTE